MKLFPILLLLCAPACSALEPVMLPTEGALSRQVQRITARHDAYVNADTSLDDGSKLEYLAQSKAAAQMVQSAPQVQADMLIPAFVPVMDRHDAYVQADVSLDPLHKEQYLASSSGLRGLLTKARWSPKQ